MAQQFWVRTEQGTFGPYSLQQLHEMAATGDVQHHHHVSIDQIQWLPAGGFRGLHLPGPAPAPAPAPGAGDAGTSRMEGLLDEVEQEQSQQFAQQAQHAMAQQQTAGLKDYGAEKAAKFMRQAEIATNGVKSTGHIPSPRS